MNYKPGDWVYWDKDGKIKLSKIEKIVMDKTGTDVYLDINSTYSKQLHVSEVHHEPNLLIKNFVKEKVEELIELDKYGLKPVITDYNTIEFRIEDETLVTLLV